MTSEELQRQIEAAPRVALAQLIEIIDSRWGATNRAHVEGVTINKAFAPTVANLGETDLRKYKRVPIGAFAANLMHIGRDGTFPVALNNTKQDKIVSPAYCVFRILKKNILNPLFLFTLFQTQTFDRRLWFNTDSSVRGNLTWEDMCRVKIPLPPIEVQRAYVNAYKGLTALIEQNEALLKTLEQAAQACVAECKDKWPMVELQNMIAEVNERNSDMALSSEDVVGIATSKEFIGTKADLTGVNVKGYKIVEEKNFAFVSDTSRRGDKMSLAFNSLGRKILVTSIATVLRVTRLDQLCPEYLFLQFKRPEFDRYARFNSWGSARETFNWEDMCRVKIPLPPIEVQRAIVALYRCAEEARKIAEEAKAQLALACPAMIQQASRRC